MGGTRSMTKTINYYLYQIGSTNPSGCTEVSPEEAIRLAALLSEFFGPDVAFCL